MPGVRFSEYSYSPPPPGRGYGKPGRVDMGGPPPWHEAGPGDFSPAFEGDLPEFGLPDLPPTRIPGTGFGSPPPGISRAFSSSSASSIRLESANVTPLRHGGTHRQHAEVMGYDPYYDAPPAGYGQTRPPYGPPPFEDRPQTQRKKRDPEAYKQFLGDFIKARVDLPLIQDLLGDIHHPNAPLSLDAPLEDYELARRMVTGTINQLSRMAVEMEPESEETRAIRDRMKTLASIDKLLDAKALVQSDLMDFVAAEKSKREFFQDFLDTHQLNGFEVMQLRQAETQRRQVSARQFELLREAGKIMVQLANQDPTGGGAKNLKTRLASLSQQFDNLDVQRFNLESGLREKMIALDPEHFVALPAVATKDSLLNKASHINLVSWGHDLDLQREVLEQTRVSLNRVNMSLINLIRTMHPQSPEARNIEKRLGRIRHLDMALSRTQAQVEYQQQKYRQELMHYQQVDQFMAIHQSTQNITQYRELETDYRKIVDAQIGLFNAQGAILTLLTKEDPDSSKGLSLQARLERLNDVLSQLDMRLEQHSMGLIRLEQSMSIRDPRSSWDRLEQVLGYSINTSKFEGTGDILGG